MSEPASDNPASAQAAAAARKARRKKTRWGADKDITQETDAQAGSTAVATPVVTASVPPQQEIASLKLNSVPSGTPFLGQLTSTSASGQAVSSSHSAGTPQVAAAAAAANAYPW